jgi:CRISPR-associated endoribonuclease Cas6
MSVAELTIVQDPNFGIVKRFEVASPIFIKRHVGDRTKFYYYNDDEANALMTETLVNKLKKADLNHENVSVEFDKTYRNPTKKGTTYKGIKSIGSICPVIIKGTPEQIAFAWNVGLGNSTGIGFGALV